MVKHCLLSQVHDCTVVGIEAGGLSSPWTSNRGVLGETVSVLCVSERRDISERSQRGEASSQRGEASSVLCVSERRSIVCVSERKDIVCPLRLVRGMEHVPGVILTRYIAVWRFVCAYGGRVGLEIMHESSSEDCV